MLKTNDIKYRLLKELKWGRIKETGYDCLSGSEYVEIRNALFEVDKDYIFNNVRLYQRVPEQWYVENYDPILYRNNQFDNFINKIGKNPLTRQAILFMGDSYEYEIGDGMICTMYMHVFLDHINDNNYNMEYIVHMRSNDAIEFGNDIKWHRKIIDKIIICLSKFYNINIKDTTIIWNADSFHVYKEYFNLVLNN